MCRVKTLERQKLLVLLKKRVPYIYSPLLLTESCRWPSSSPPWERGLREPSTIWAVKNTEHCLNFIRVCFQILHMVKPWVQREHQYRRRLLLWYYTWVEASHCCVWHYRDRYTSIKPTSCFDIKYFYIWYLQSKPCLDEALLTIHLQRIYTWRFDSHLSLGWWGAGGNSIEQCVRARESVCVGLRAEPKGVEKAHIKPTKVYLKSQALFGLERNNKQMYTWTRTIIRGVPGLLAALPVLNAEKPRKNMKPSKTNKLMAF